MARKGIEVRLNRDGTLDEVVADRCMFHLEQMSGTHWWLAVDLNGQSCHVNLHSKARITATFRMKAMSL